MHKGQASLETLAGYGWMIVAVMLIFAAMFYFGVIPVKALLPDTCTSQDKGFFCVDKAGYTGSSLVIALSNFAEQRITIFDGSSGNDPTGIHCTFSSQLALQNYNAQMLYDIPAAGVPVGPKTQFNLVAQILNEPTESTCTLEFSYRNDESGLDHRAKVEFTNPTLV